MRSLNSLDEEHVIVYSTFYPINIFLDSSLLMIMGSPALPTIVHNIYILHLYLIEYLEDRKKYHILRVDTTSHWQYTDNESLSGLYGIAEWKVTYFLTDSNYCKLFPIMIYHIIIHGQL